MNWYLLYKIADHCTDRIQQRLTPYKNEIAYSLNWARALYGYKSHPVAVVIHEFPQVIVSPAGFGENISNGDWVIAILRPGIDSAKLDCKTIMLRRSPKQQAAQPFTPSALNVGEVVDYSQFLSGKQKIEDIIRKQRESKQKLETPSEIQPEAVQNVS